MGKSISMNGRAKSRYLDFARPFLGRMFLIVFWLLLGVDWKLSNARHYKLINFQALESFQLLTSSDFSYG